MRDVLLICAVLLAPALVSCTRRTTPIYNYSVSIMPDRPDRIICDGKRMTPADIEQHFRQEVGEYGIFSFNRRVSIYVKADVRYGRVMSCVNVQALNTVSDYSLSVGSEKPIQVYIRHGDYTAVLEELITVDEKSFRTKDGIIPFGELDQYLSDSKAIDKNFRVILMATTNAVMMDFYNALVISKRHTEDVLWGFGDGAIVHSSGDWKRWRPRGDVMTEYKRNAQPTSTGDVPKAAPEK